MNTSTFSFLVRRGHKNEPEQVQISFGNFSPGRNIDVGWHHTSGIISSRRETRRRLNRRLFILLLVFRFVDIDIIATTASTIATATIAQLGRAFTAGRSRYSGCWSIWSRLHRRSMRRRGSRRGRSVGRRRR